MTVSALERLMNRVLIASFLVTTSVSSAAAQTPVRLDLPESIARGLAASHRLAEAVARQSAAEAVTDQRQAASMPQVSLQAGYMRTNHVDEFGIPGGQIIYPDIPNNFRSRVDLQWPIYTAGRTGALTKAAGAEASAVQRDTAAARLDLKLEITRAYWAVITGNASVTVVQQALDLIGAHLNDVRNQLNVGLVPPNDVLSVEAQQAREQGLLIQAQNVADTAAVDFRRLVGLAPDVPFELVDRMDAPTPVPGAIPALIDAARASRPERQALQVRLEAAADRFTAADAGRFPVVATAAGYDVARPNPKIFPRELAVKPSWDASINVNWSVFDGGRVRAEIAEAAATRTAAEERLRDFDLSIDAEVRRSLNDLTSAQAAIPASEAGVRSAAEARRVVAERFAAGVATNTDVMDAQSALLAAELERTRALANAKLAEARLERALGR